MHTTRVWIRCLRQSSAGECSIDSGDPGSGKLSADIQDKIDDFIKGQNDTSELFFFIQLPNESSFSILFTRPRRLK